MTSQAGPPRAAVRAAPDDLARLDDLRRRLYRPDATPADVDHYVAQQQAARPAAVADEPERSRARRPDDQQRSDRRVVLLVALGAAVTLLAATQLLRAPAAPNAVAASRAPADVTQDFGDGQVIVVREGAAAPPMAFATSVGAQRAIGQRFEGTGNAVVAVTPPAGTRPGGRVSVLLSAPAGSRAVWRALLTVRRTDWTAHTSVMAEGRAHEASGVPDPTRFTYAAAPPTRIAVEAPDGQPWSLLVAVIDGTAPERR